VNLAFWACLIAFLAAKVWVGPATHAMSGVEWMTARWYLVNAGGWDGMWLTLCVCARVCVFVCVRRVCIVFAVYAPVLVSVPALLVEIFLGHVCE